MAKKPAGSFFVGNKDKTKIFEIAEQKIPTKLIGIPCPECGTDFQISIKWIMYEWDLKNGKEFIRCGNCDFKFHTTAVYAALEVVKRYIEKGLPPPPPIPLNMERLMSNGPQK